MLGLQCIVFNVLQLNWSYQFHQQKTETWNKQHIHNLMGNTHDSSHLNPTQQSHFLQVHITILDPLRLPRCLKSVMCSKWLIGDHLNISYSPCSPTALNNVKTLVNKAPSSFSWQSHLSRITTLLPAWALTSHTEQDHPGRTLHHFNHLHPVTKYPQGPEMSLFFSKTLSCCASDQQASYMPWPEITWEAGWLEKNKFSKKKKTQTKNNPT